MIKFEDLDSKLVVWNSKVFVTRNLLLHNDLFTFGSKLFPRLISLIKICCSECQFIIKLCTAHTDCGCTKSIINFWFVKTVINIWSQRYYVMKIFDQFEFKMKQVTSTGSICISLQKSFNSCDKVLYVDSGEWWMATTDIIKWRFCRKSEPRIGCLSQLIIKTEQIMMNCSR